MEAKETIGKGGGRKYANSQFSNQNRQDAISRVLAVQNSATGPRWEHWRSLRLAAQKHSHISSAGCEGMATTVTAAHHSIWWHLYDSMHATQKPNSNLKFVTFDSEINISTLGRRKEFLEIFSKEDLVDKAQAIEVTIPVIKSQETWYEHDPVFSFVNRSWGRRPDGVAIHDFCRSNIFQNSNGQQTGTGGFLEAKEAEANEQHKSIIGDLRAVAP